MMKKYFKKVKRNRGVAMLISVVFFLFISLAIIAGLVAPAVREFKNANVNLNSKQSYFLAESGSEDAAYRTIKNMTIGGNTTINLNSNSATVTITSISSSLKQIVSLGSVSSYERKTTLTLSTGAGVSFNYGVQVGDGGLQMDSNSTVNGNIYSNGNITGASGAVVTNSAVVAGATGAISNVSVGQNGVGNAQAHTVNNSTIAGTLYCQVGSGNNKSCNTSQPNPSPQNMPLSSTQITTWENDATAGGTVGDQSISGSVSLGPKKINGNLTINGNATLTITGTVWVTGTISVNNGATVKLSSGYGGSSGILMAGVAGDSTKGQIDLSNNVTLLGSGTTGSYLLVLSERNNTTNTAIGLSNNVTGAIFYAGTGVIDLSNNAAAKEVTAYKLHLNSNATVTYESGLASSSFSSGPSGSWKVQTWKESQ